MTRSDPRPLLQHAALLERQGRLADAEALYSKVLAEWPELADTWYNLARLQRRAGKFDAALASYQQALDRGIEQPEEVHLNRGVIYSDCLRRDEAAEQELQTALALNPQYVPALFNLANLREDYGRRSDALELYERILALEPGNHEALSRYASLKLARQSDDPLVARLQAALRTPGIDAAARASLGFALGKVLDACGDYDAAFDAYSAANRAGRIHGYDRAAHERFVDELIRCFDTTPPAMTQALQPEPIFICGMFRSGSTLTEQVLAAHSQVEAGGELAFLPALANRTLAPFPASMKTIAEPQLRILSEQYLKSLSQLFPGAMHVTDKRPDNFLYIGLIKRLFPAAKIVHTTRDPLDNCLSIFFLHLDPGMRYAFDLMDIGHYYAQYRRLMAHWKSLYGADILDFDYDTFVREPEASTRRLTDFCGLDWEDACLSFYTAAKAVKTASVWQVRQPVYRQSSGRWQNYERQLEPLRQCLELHGIARS